MTDVDILGIDRIFYLNKLKHAIKFIDKGQLDDATEILRIMERDFGIPGDTPCPPNTPLFFVPPKCTPKAEVIIFYPSESG